MAKAEPILPLDLSVLDQFKFIDGPGNYSDRRVCTMTALYLVTEIAKGNITLEDAISTSEYGQQRLKPSDRVQCVSPVLNDLVIQRNDQQLKLEERRKWAMNILPRIVGTNLGHKFETRLRKLSDQAHRDYLVGEAKRLAQKFIETGDIDLLREATDLDEYGGEDPSLELLDAQIEAIIAEADKEKARRAARNAARR